MSSIANSLSDALRDAQNAAAAHKAMLADQVSKVVEFRSQVEKRYDLFDARANEGAETNDRMRIAPWRTDRKLRERVDAEVEAYRKGLGDISTERLDAALGKVEQLAPLFASPRSTIESYGAEDPAKMETHLATLKGAGFATLQTRITLADARCDWAERAAILRVIDTLDEHAQAKLNPAALAARWTGGFLPTLQSNLARSRYDAESARVYGSAWRAGREVDPRDLIKLGLLESQTRIPEPKKTATPDSAAPIDLIRAGLEEMRAK